MKFTEILRKDEEREAEWGRAFRNDHVKVVAALKQAELCENMIGFLNRGHFDKAWELAKEIERIERG